MELFIRIVDGNPVDHPILGENFRQAFPEIDLSNLPPQFARFVRVAAPSLGPYEKNQTVTYELVDGVYTDVFSCEQLTQEEITAKQDEVKTSWVQIGYPSWVFNEATCMFDPPTPRPTDGGVYRWDEPTLGWIMVQEPPLAEQPIIIETAGSYLDLPVEEVVIVDLGSNGADSVPGGV